MLIILNAIALLRKERRMSVILRSKDIFKVSEVELAGDDNFGASKIQKFPIT